MAGSIEELAKYRYEHGMEELQMQRKLWVWVVINLRGIDLTMQYSMQ